ncbi:DUF4238 domain-containing protein [Fictibacillus enclensis]|uniref:DUF4238 domain-containing protein n=1 Tax=Fictibacillus enclensis TaxID=1017270 RepID=UPI0025A00EDC|nr:DUF4238 domain-containing protein [Fictibacillus enclensis]MDM5338509.1 DUF4238 domain-containing protein [Fictibacillus enclensis]
MRHVKPKQHYIPATILGKFSNQEKGNRRKRLIWVKRKNSDQLPRIDIPENVGYKKHLYTMKDEDINTSFVDDQWKHVEENIQTAIENFICNKDGKMNASYWTVQ